MCRFFRKFENDVVTFVSSAARDLHWFEKAKRVGARGTREVERGREKSRWVGILPFLTSPKCSARSVCGERKRYNKRLQQQQQVIGILRAAGHILTRSCHNADKR